MSMVRYVTDGWKTTATVTRPQPEESCSHRRGQTPAGQGHVVALAVQNPSRSLPPLSRSLAFLIYVSRNLPIRCRDPFHE